jgi:hypothetical protein
MNLLSFCLHSLVRQYGWRFFRRVAVRHPIRTARALVDCASRDVGAEPFCTPGREHDAGPRVSIVAAGFCLKPLDPPCPSGRPNHDCHFLDRLPDLTTAPPVSCKTCAIRKIGMTALRSDAAFYIMTSATDILRDVFEPSAGNRRFTCGLFVLCRYSFRPFLLGLLASGLEGRLLPLEQGDCRDYRTWLRADRGLKDERTTVAETSVDILGKILEAQAPAADAIARCSRQGNIYLPTV